MPAPLAILIVEDVESDAQLMVRLLKKADYELVYEQVETNGEMRAALKKRNWDIVISDYKMPQFDGYAALKLLQETGLDIPFIVVSGTIGEETAVSMMKAGAHDYLVKGDLARLLPAVERELGQAEIRRGRRQAEESLKESEEKYRELVQDLPDTIAVYIDGKIVFVNNACVQLLRAKNAAELLGRSVIEFVHPDFREFVKSRMLDVMKSGKPLPLEEEKFVRLDGTDVDVEVKATPITFEKKPAIQVIVRDITKRKLAEKALAESEIKFRWLYEYAPVAYHLLTPDGTITDVNRKWCEVLGYRREEAIGKAIFDFVVDEEKAEAQASFKKKKRSKQPFVEGSERKFSTKDGTVRIFKTYDFLVLDQKHNIISIQTTIEDITEHKQAEEAIQTTNILLEQTLEQSPVPMVLVSMPDGIIRSANSACRHFLGMDDEPSPVGMPLSELNVSYQDFDMQGNPAIIEDLPLTRSLRGLRTVQERHIIRKDGTSVYGLVYGSPIFNDAGKLIAGYLVMVDITERKQAEEELRKLSRAVDQSPASIVITDLLGNIEYVNPKFSQISGYSFTEALGKNPRILKSGHSTREEYKKMWDAILSGNVWQGEFLNKKKNGETYWEFATIAPVFSEDGKITNFLALKENITDRKQAEENTHQRVKELELLYQSGLALGRLLNPKEIGQKILELLREKMGWHHTRIRLYRPQDDSLELLDFNQPGLQGEAERRNLVERFQTLITRSGEGMSGWVTQNGQSIRSGDVGNDPRYIEAQPGIHSGLYVPMKLGERVVGVISIEDEQLDAFSAADEQLIVTLANQAASAFENARLFEETRQRVMELETLNRISLVLRAVSKQEEMLEIVLDEALAILNTPHGSIELYNKTMERLDKTIMRGWIAQVIETPSKPGEGIAGKVFASGETYISREFASDPETRATSRSQIPLNWGGIFLPIRTTQQILGVMVVCVPSNHELNKDEIRLLSILSEMTGAALQRMQLHEQTVRRLEQLHALRTVDQAIVSNFDMRLTLNILLDHTISQLGVDAADVLLLSPGSNLLELAAGHGFHTLLLESTSLSDSFAKRAVMEHRLISVLDFESAALRKKPQFGKLWKEEGFVCYWCVPLVIKGEVKGVLEVYGRTAFTPDAEWLEFLEALAGQAAIAIDSTQLFENLQRANMDLSLAYDATIEGWSRAMDLRDHETEGHTLRVTDLTLKLARAMHISESQLTAIRRGALLHDIGKMGVPDAILLKEGALTDEEWSVMRKHPELARDMLMPIAYLNDALNIPYCHHEKWDGTGYPQGLKGDRIPLTARIFAVIDVWDALTNDRNYRRKWTEQSTRQYIKEQSGRHFDPQVVEVFLKQIGNEL